MKYRPAYPERNVNISHNSPVREFVVLLSGVSVIFCLVFLLLGALVDIAVQSISPTMEGRIFASVSPQIKQSLQQASPQETKLQEMTDALSACAGIHTPLRVHLVADDMANAMAIPGGRIVVFQGLLHQVQTENGLAFVLAHELAHFKNRDHLRGMGRGIVLTAMMAVLSGPDSSLTRLFAPVVGLNQAQYSQERESAADQRALQTLVCQYGNAAGATEFFTAMAKESKKGTLSSYFASHPEATERITQLNQSIKELQLPVAKPRPLPAILQQTQ